MKVPEFPHLPPDIADGIARYDAMRDSGRLTYGREPDQPFDQPVIDGVPYITEDDYGHV